jgi:hypothetical protein
MAVELEVERMCRAISISVLSLSFVALLSGSLAAAPQTVNMVNAIGLIDYSRKPDFKIGSWIKYHMAGSSELGMVDDYTVTVLIAGEERFWGEDCFWVETWTEPKNSPPTVVATLMSYAIFDDSLAAPHMQLYSRKMISDIAADGTPIQNVTRRAGAALKSRAKPALNQRMIHVDTLGIESVTVPKGTYQCRKITMRQDVATNADVGDSTIRTEVRDDRTIYMSREIPITGIAREDVDNSIKRKTWKAGESQDAPMRTMEHASGSAQLIDFGTGLTPQVVPEVYRRSIRESLPAQNQKPAPAKPRSARRAG